MLESIYIGKWGFDDYGIGWLPPSAMSLTSRPLRRPKGYNTKDWRILAGRTIRTKNSRLMTLDALHKVMLDIDADLRGHNHF